MLLASTSLALTGQRWLHALQSEVDEADPDGLIAPRSRILCAALGTLSTSAALALGASPEAAEEAGLAGAALSLLTKLDDEVIDSLAFHGGSKSVRSDVEKRTRHYLAPTLDALSRGAKGECYLDPFSPDDRPRSLYAHSVGRRLAALSDNQDRLRHVLTAIEVGWDVQARAAAVLTAHPSSVDSREVLFATRSISGAWLGMITLVGELADGAKRAISDGEVDAIWEWGSFIQRADSLCDLEKDQRDGLSSTFVAHEAWARQSALGLGNSENDIASLYGIVASEGIDVACIPTAETRRVLAASLAPLGEVEGLLSWIFTMLFRRYLDHPMSQRDRFPGNAVEKALGAEPTSEVQSCSAP